MTARILVAYATRKGSTGEIAAAIGRELQQAGYVTDGAVTGAAGSANNRVRHSTCIKSSGYPAPVFIMHGITSC